MREGNDMGRALKVSASFCLAGFLAGVAIWLGLIAVSAWANQFIPVEQGLQVVMLVSIVGGAMGAVWAWRRPRRNSPSM